MTYNKTNKYGNSNKLGFSLIELSIVILIIGILVAGITQGSKLVAKSNLSSSRTLTQSSIVTVTDGLSMWLETTLESSIKASEAINGNSVSTWYDNQAVNNKVNATQATVANQPIYRENAINGLPALEFDGTNDNLLFNSQFLLNTNYTIFIVESRTGANASGGYLIGGSDLQAVGNYILFLGYQSNTNLWSGHRIGCCSGGLAIPAYSKPIPRIHCITQDSSITNGKQYILNGVKMVPGGIANNEALSTFQGSAIGGVTAAPTYYYKGYIGEVIMFSTALKDKEIQYIGCYLGKKWNINLPAGYCS